MFCQYMYIDRNHHLNPTQRCSKPIPALLEGIYFLKIEFHLANTNMYVIESVSFILFILIVCFVSLRTCTCTCTFLSHSDKLIHEIFARHAALYLVLEKMITIFGKLWNEIQNSLQDLFHFRKSFALCKWFFWCCFWGFYFCLVFFFWKGWG